MKRCGCKCDYINKNLKNFNCKYTVVKIPMMLQIKNFHCCRGFVFNFEKNVVINMNQQEKFQENQNLMKENFSFVWTSFSRAHYLIIATDILY